MLTVGSLFSGIGGIDYGLECTNGFKIKWQVEIDEYCTKVLAKHWPNVTRFRDIRECGKHNLTPVDVLCGGFPCQDISTAGKRAGITGERSGLWQEMYRIICELRPRYILVENVSALLYPTKRNGYIEPAPLSRVLGDLAQARYDAEWQSLQASDFGAPHKRERVFIIAYNACCHTRTKMESKTNRIQAQFRRTSHIVSSSHWKTNQPSMVGMADGISHRMDRLKALGNAVVPQCAEYIGHCILEREAHLHE